MSYKRVQDKNQFQKNVGKSTYNISKTIIIIKYQLLGLMLKIFFN